MGPNLRVQWQLVNTKFVGIGILVPVVRTSGYPNKLRVIRNSMLSGYLLASCRAVYGFLPKTDKKKKDRNVSFCTQSIEMYSFVLSQYAVTVICHSIM